MKKLTECATLHDIKVRAVEIADKFIDENSNMLFTEFEGYLFGCIHRAAEIGMLEGIKRGLEGAGSAAHDCGYYSDAYLGREPPTNVFHHNVGVWKARDSIRAIKPETLMPKESE